MRREEKNVAIPVAGQVGAGMNTSDFATMAIGIEGTFNGTLDVEGLLSSDLGTWSAIATAIGAATVVEIALPFVSVRINGANLTGAGLVNGKAKLVGFNTRTV